MEHVMQWARAPEISAYDKAIRVCAIFLPSFCYHGRQKGKQAKEAHKQHTSKTLVKKDAMHPNSRHAFQRARVVLRSRRLNEAHAARRRERSAKVDRILAFVLLLSEDKTHIPDLYAFHDFMTTFFLARHDEELAELQKAQRPGRPKSKRLLELERLIASEKREYHDGMVVPDLCNETNVELLRQWEGDPQALPLFRFVRISSSERDSFRVIQAGTHKLLQNTSSL